MYYRVCIPGTIVRSEYWQIFLQVNWTRIKKAQVSPRAIWIPQNKTPRKHWCARNPR